MARKKAQKLLTADDILPRARPGEAKNKKGEGILSVARSVLFLPYGFFEKLAKNPSALDGSMNYVLTLGLVPSIYGFFTYFFFYGRDFPKALQVASLEYLIVIFLFSVSVLATHSVLRLLGGKERIAATFKTCAFAATPWLLFSSIPIAALFGLAWSVYLQTVGLSTVAQVKKWKALVATLVPVAIGTAAGIWLILSYPIPALA